MSALFRLINELLIQYTEHNGSGNGYRDCIFMSELPGVRLIFDLWQDIL
jgi:hypothetical protein